MDERVILTLVKMVEMNMLVAPRYFKLLSGVKNAFEAQKAALEKGSFQTVTNKQVRFRVEGEKIIFPHQGALENELQFNLNWFKEK